jgi:hypothetical protein
MSTGIRSKEEATEHPARLLAVQPPIPRYDRKKQVRPRDPSRRRGVVLPRHRPRQLIVCCASYGTLDSPANSTGS